MGLCAPSVSLPLIRSSTLTIVSSVVADNDEPFIRYLLSQGADPNLGRPLSPQEPVSWRIRPIPNSGMALNAAAASGTPEIFALLLSHGAILSNAIPLHRAAGVRPEVPAGSRIPMMEYLLGLGLDVNAIDDAARRGAGGQGQYGTPLHYAVRWGRVEEARWLLDNGADPDKRSPSGITARDWVNRRAAETELANLLREY